MVDIISTAAKYSFTPIFTVTHNLREARQVTSPFVNRYLRLAGIAASAGAALNIAIIFGGPDGYAFFGAPPGLIEMARSGHVRAPLTCLVIAAFLALLAAYAFSGAGVIRRLPFLRIGLGAIAAVLILRGALFIPLIVWRPGALAGICDCRSVDTFTVVTSALCLAMGVGYALGAMAAIAAPYSSFKRAGQPGN
ncbi:MAG: hypothetical protein ABI790_10810 [Betaproteobacteria bacterium]